jgi:hypothetical protein
MAGPWGNKEPLKGGNIIVDGALGRKKKELCKLGHSGWWRIFSAAVARVCNFSPPRIV